MVYLQSTLSTVYRAVTWFVPSVRSRLVILEEFGFRSRRPDQVSCDWRRAGHVTPVLTSYGQAERISLYLSETSHSDWLIIYYLAQSMDKGNFYEFILKVEKKVKIFTSNKNICKMSGTGETHIADENDRDNERDDSTLPLKK